MIYKVTTLKDLPGIKTGTEFRYVNRSFSHDPELKLFNQTRPYLESEVEKFLIEQVILGNPDGWVQIEPYYNDLTDMKCPVCGETRGLIQVDWAHGHSSNPDVMIEYACGHQSRSLLDKTSQMGERTP